MNDAFHAAASALDAVTRELEVATGNAVNSATPGYLSRVLATRSFATVLDRELDREPSLVGTIEVTAFRQGNVVRSDAPHAVALRGPGFLAVQTPLGVRYTRNGDLEVGPAGLLRTRAGYPVLGAAGPLRSLPGGPPVRIARGGIVRQGDQEVGRIRIVEFDRPERLLRAGETLFEAPPEAGLRPARDTELVPGMLELPPERAISGLVSMIAANRTFEAAQRVVSTINRSYGRLLRSQ